MNNIVLRSLWMTMRPMLAFLLLIAMVLGLLILIVQWPLPAILMIALTWAGVAWRENYKKLKNKGEASVPPSSR